MFVLFGIKFNGEIHVFEYGSLSDCVSVFEGLTLQEKEKFVFIQLLLLDD